ELPPPGAGLLTVTGLLPAVAIAAALIVALTCVALSSVVVWATPSKWITEPLMKFVPVTVSVKAASQAGGLVGGSLLLVCTGFAASPARLSSDLELPPPGAGLLTVTGLLPAVAIAAALIVALTCVALSSVVVCATPSKWITEPLMKFVPVTVSVKAAS